MNILAKILSSIGRSAQFAGLLLLIPLIGHQFSAEMNWTLSDFMIAGFLLFSTGFVFNLVTMHSSKITYRIAVGFALFTGLFLIWVNLAVGIIGSENHPVNQLYFGVIMVGIIGAFIVRFQPQGLAFTLFAMASAQALVTEVALLTGVHHSPDITLYHILAVNGFFFTLFAVAGMLLLYADEQHSPNDRQERLTDTRSKPSARYSGTSQTIHKPTF